ncbi:MAG: TetR/AcrR family transcriptional regulator, partial [Bacillota bacterium]
NLYECLTSKEELLIELEGLFQGFGIEIPNERKLILEQAEEGISRHGFNNITLEMIAKAAGMNRGTIYKHFSDKYELLECCIDYQFSKIKDIMSMVYNANQENPEDFIRNYLENYRNFLNHSYDSSVFTEAWSHLNYRRKIKKYTFELQEHLRGLFLQCLNTGISQGIFKKNLNLNAITDFMLFLYSGMAFFLNKEEEREKISRESVDTMVDAILQMIRV